MLPLPEKEPEEKPQTARWIEISRASASTRMSVDLNETGLGDAMRLYASQYPIRPIPFLDADGVIQYHHQDPYTDLCRSHYEADSSDLKGAIRYIEGIIDLDFDAEKSREDNFRAAAGAARKLINLFVTHDVPYRTYFSGSKGFHLTLPGLAFWPFDADTGRLEFVHHGNLILRRMVRSICTDANVPESTRGRKGNAGWDASLYDLRRMVRLPGVPHGKSLVISMAVLGHASKIYKTALPPQWRDWSIPQIVEFSTARRAVPAWNSTARNHWLEELWEKAAIATDKDHDDEPIVYSASALRTLRPRAADAPASLADLKGHPPCIAGIRQDAIITMGLRNSIGIAVCSFHASAGDSLEEAITTMRHVPSRSQNLDAETIGQWNGVTQADRKTPKDTYRFSNRSCRVLRSCGAPCTDQCALHVEFSKGEKDHARRVPCVRRYDWGTVPMIRLEEV